MFFSSNRNVVVGDVCKGHPDNRLPSVFSNLFFKRRPDVTERERGKKINIKRPGRTVTAVLGAKCVQR